MHYHQTWLVFVNKKCLYESICQAQVILNNQLVNNQHVIPTSILSYTKYHTNTHAVISS